MGVVRLGVSGKDRSPFGSKLSSVWRYVDMGFSLQSGGTLDRATNAT